MVFSDEDLNEAPVYLSGWFYFPRPIGRGDKQRGTILKII